MGARTNGKTRQCTVSSVFSPSNAEVGNTGVLKSEPSPAPHYRQPLRLLKNLAPGHPRIDKKRKINSFRTLTTQTIFLHPIQPHFPPKKPNRKEKKKKSR